MKMSTITLTLVAFTCIIAILISLLYYSTEREYELNLKLRQSETKILKLKYEIKALEEVHQNDVSLYLKQEEIINQNTKLIEECTKRKSSY